MGAVLWLVMLGVLGMGRLMWLLRRLMRMLLLVLAFVIAIRCGRRCGWGARVRRRVCCAAVLW